MAKMSPMTKFVQAGFLTRRFVPTKIYQIFMVPKPADPRLSTNMQTMHTNWQTWEQLAVPGAYGVEKESKLKLSVEARNRGDVIVVHCQGRIVYRDEAAALSRVAGEVLHNGTKLVLDLSGVSSMDSAGIGELALLQTWAQERNAEMKFAAPSTVVQTLLDLTNLDSVLEVHPTLESAVESFHEAQICVD